MIQRLSFLLPQVFDLCPQPLKQPPAAEQIFMAITGASTSTAHPSRSAALVQEGAGEDGR